MTARPCPPLVRGVASGCAIGPSTTGDGRAKTAVDRVGRGKQRDINARFLAMTSHYLFEPEFCNPAAGWEKGQVEKNVRDARRHAEVNRPLFAGG